MQFLRPSGREKPLTFLRRNTRGRSSFGGPSPLRPPQAFASPRRPAYDGGMEDPEVMVVEDIAEEVALPHATHVNGEGGVSPPSSPVTVPKVSSRSAITAASLDADGLLAPEEVRRQLLAIYGTRAPRKLELVDELLDHWRGRENQLLALVRDRHLGEVERRLQYYRCEIRQLYAAHNPPMLERLDELLGEWADREDVLLQQLREEYNVEAVDRWQSLADRTVRARAFHPPSLASTLRPCAFST
jgi:hypothetical protein